MGKTVDWRRWAFIIIWGTIAIGTLFSLLFLLKSSPLSISESINSQIFGDYGSFIGGIASSALGVASVLLIIQSINDTRTNNIKQQIEGRFFELIKIHRENRNELERNNNSPISIFEQYVNEFNEIYPVVEKIGGKSQLNLSDVEKTNIAFLCFYYGCLYVTNRGNYSYQLTAKVLRKFVNANAPSFISELLLALIEKKATPESENYSYELFTGHQSDLGHYYRHLFQTVKYIDEQPSTIMTYLEKYRYIKVLRAQLSTDEQILFLLNSLSDLGKAWEYDSNLSENQKLITKYNLIKNIPIDIAPTYVNYSKYYPQINYETQGADIDERKKLERLYK